MADNGSSVRAVERAMLILRAFGQGDRSLSLGEISRRVDLAKSTTHRLLLSLEQGGFIKQDELTGEYQLGFAIIHIASIALGNLDLARVAHDVMENVAQTSGQTCNLYIRQNDHRVCIAQVSGPHYIRRHSYMGATLPLYCGASGKVLLAYSDLKFQEGYLERNILEKLAENTITDPEILRAEFQSIRERGYALSSAERDEMTASVAAPVYDHTGKIMAALTVSGANVLFPNEKMETYGSILKSAAAEISSNMGYIEH